MRIGITRSGTVIEYKPNQGLTEFICELKSLAGDEQFDAHCIYQWLVVSSKRQYKKESDDYLWWLRRFIAIESNFSVETLEEEKLKANAKTSYEMLQLGIKMVDGFWR